MNYIIVHTKPEPFNGLSTYYTEVGAPLNDDIDLKSWLAFKAGSIGINQKKITGYMSIEEYNSPFCNQYIKSL